MPKRFTATEKWEDYWFRRLSPDYKLLWLYLLDKCNLAGLWEKDFELASQLTGSKYDEKDLMKVFNGRLVEIDRFIFIPKFIEFQYGCDFRDLDEAKPIHKAVIKTLNKYNLHTLLIEYGESIDRVQYMVKDKDMVKEKVKVKEKDSIVAIEIIHPLQKFIADNYTNITKLSTQLTSGDAEKLITEFGKESVEDVLDAMENCKTLTKKYTSVYLTANNWLKMRKEKQTNENDRFDNRTRKYKFDASKYPTLNKPPA